MVTSLSKGNIDWKLVSTNVGIDCESYEYEAAIFNSKKKYHMSVLVTPKGEHRSYSVS